MKKCEIFNYIPLRKSKGVTYEKWFSRYMNDIAELYLILIRTFSNEYDDSYIDWNKNFAKFSRLVYKKSSKNILRNNDI